MGNRLKTIDFIDDFELHSTKKRQKRPIFDGFYGIPVG
jgi:hypothetical protein